jgi:amino-acid N-acetyltransferase
MTPAMAAPAVPLVQAADPEHVDAMARIVAGHARRGLMLPRSPGELIDSLPDFLVVDHGGEVMAMGGLRFYSGGSAEVIGLAVQNHARGSGFGRRVVEALVGRARAGGADRLFALTLEPAFFERLGFREISFGAVPEKVTRDCVACPFRVGCRETPVGLDLRGGAHTSQGGK